MIFIRCLFLWCWIFTMISKNKINILHITQSAGGVETYLLLIFKYLNKNRFSNTLLCTNNGSLGSRALHLGINIQLIPMIREINVFSNLIRFYGYVGFYIKTNLNIILYMCIVEKGDWWVVYQQNLSVQISLFLLHMFSHICNIMDFNEDAFCL